MSEKTILFDATKCIGCRGCQVACKQWNELKAVTTTNVGTYENPPDLSPNTWLTIKFQEEPHNVTIDWFFGRRSCMHCTNAACVDICPTGAVYHNEFGAVAYDKSKCIGCGYCQQYCPFDVPRLDVSRASGVGKMDKCTLCTTPGLDRIAEGQKPACVKTCPTEALLFGDRSELLAEGQRRVANLKTLNPGATLYGEKELGGLHVLYVLADSPAVYHLPVDPQFPVAATVQKQGFRPYAGLFWGVVAAGLALNVLVARARELRRKEAH